MLSKSHLHPALGTIVGLQSGEDVVQFRGIPYAEIPSRFRQSTLRTRLPCQPFDARQPGPVCPQTPLLPFPQYWSGPLPRDGVKLEKPRADELHCLNLNITLPRLVLESFQNVPVLVFIHGGAFMVGSSSTQVSGREVWDATNLVRYSLSSCKPIIVVSINYRHGPFGFLASKELAAYNRQYDEAVGNYGLHDQRQALEWVSRFIGGFGGDANNITIDGGSAGAVSCHFQSMFPDRKFKRAILFSGTCLALGAMPLEWHQQRFDRFNHRFRGDGCPVKRLQRVSADALAYDVVGVFYNPYIDGDWIPERTVSALKHVAEPPEIMIGSCSFEQDLTLGLFTALPSSPSTERNDKSLQMLIHSMITTLGLTTCPDRLLSPQILEHYGLSSTLETPTRQLSTWAQFVAELIFRIPPLHVALNHAGSRIYVYDFQATTPYAGYPLGYRKASHAISEVFQFDSGSDLVNEEHRAEYAGAVRELRDCIIDFCHGRLNWESFDTTDNERLGPVYTFANNGRGRKYGSLGDVVGQDVLRRWKAVLAVAE